MRDFSATPALVTLAPRGAVRGFTLFVHGGRSNSVASGSRLQPPALRMYSFLMGVRRDGLGHGVAACQLRHGVRGDDEGDPPSAQVGRPSSGRSVRTATRLSARLNRAFALPDEHAGRVEL